jgi:hypothetical protein
MFSLMHHHKFNLAEWECMEPWERDVYIKLLNNSIEAENEEVRKQQAAEKSHN